MSVVGEQVPDAALLDVEGRQVRLSALWQEQPVVFVFLRWLG